ncbi:MAG TPA: DUF2178 domain-containing protein [Candidatus Pacearchaeota archaeon]|nr:DUF2178 domain-containing protein [Candidatus Pacearchaeota archaeon]HPR79651.1 DUF2178 domain-containing protein [Candidatus Pacearchaeota archaeon]
MTLKTYNKIKLGIVVITTFIFSQFLVLRNFFIPIMVLGLSSFTLFYLRKKVIEVVADERDYQIGGKSALLAIQLTSWIGVIIMFILYALSNANPFYQPIAMTLAFSVCILMITYSFIFKYYSKHNPKDEKRD